MNIKDMHKNAVYVIHSTENKNKDLNISHVHLNNVHNIYRTVSVDNCFVYSLYFVFLSTCFHFNLRNLRINFCMLVFSSFPFMQNGLFLAHLCLNP